jgi:multiple sugar transport system permease protein
MKTDRWGRTHSQSLKRSILIRKWISYVVLALGAFIMIVPFLWSISTSLKLPAEVFAWPPQWIPAPPRLDAYLEVFSGISFGKNLYNTFVISIAVSIGQLMTCSMAGYAFAKLRFPGRNTFFIAYLATMMVPGVVIMIPNFVVMRHLGWLDSHKALIIPALTSAYGTFLMRQFFLTFPSELEDAAKLDGCNPITFYWHILLPNSKPILATLGVFTFQNMWNDFLWPLIILNSQEKRTLQVGLSYLQNANYADWTLLMAGSVITMLPLIVLFFFAQRYFIQSIKLSGLKG